MCLLLKMWSAFFSGPHHYSWSMFKMDTHMDGSVLAVLAAYQNNLVT